MANLTQLLQSPTRNAVVADLSQAASPNDLFEYAFTQRGLRTGLSETLRALARQAPFSRHRYALVDLANQVRPVTTF